eukprot:SAG11_NODE_15444_length_578_cov_0.958246_1_plen_89_part_01
MLGRSLAVACAASLCPLPDAASVVVVPLAGFNAIYACATGNEAPGELVKCSEKGVTCKGPLGAAVPPVMFFRKTETEDGCSGGCLSEEK